MIDGINVNDAKMSQEDSAKIDNMMMVVMDFIGWYTHEQHPEISKKYDIFFDCSFSPKDET